MERRSLWPNCELLAIIRTGNEVETAVAVEVKLDGLPEMIGDVLKPLPGAVGFIVVLAVDMHCSVVRRRWYACSHNRLGA